MLEQLDAALVVAKQRAYEKAPALHHAFNFVRERILHRTMSSKIASAARSKTARHVWARCIAPSPGELLQRPRAWRGRSGWKRSWSLVSAQKRSRVVVRGVVSAPISASIAVERHLHLAWQSSVTAATFAAATRSRAFVATISAPASGTVISGVSASYEGKRLHIVHRIARRHQAERAFASWQGRPCGALTKEQETHLAGSRRPSLSP